MLLFGASNPSIEVGAHGNLDPGKPVAQVAQVLNRKSARKRLQKGRTTTCSIR